MESLQPVNLGRVPTSAILDELRARGWRVAWSHDDDPHDGNVTAWSPPVALEGSSLVTDAADRLDVTEPQRRAVDDFIVHDGGLS